MNRTIFITVSYLFILVLFLEEINTIQLGEDLSDLDAGDVNTDDSLLWNFSDVDKLLIASLHNDKKFGKAVCSFHNEKNKTDSKTMDFKVNNRLIYIHNDNDISATGTYINMDENDQKMLIEIFNSKELKSSNEQINLKSLGSTSTIANNKNLKLNWFSSQFIGDINNPLLKNINKTMSWFPNKSKSKISNSLERLFINKRLSSQPLNDRIEKFKQELLQLNEFIYDQLEELNSKNSSVTRIDDNKQINDSEPIGDISSTESTSESPTSNDTISFSDVYNKSGLYYYTYKSCISINRKTAIGTTISALLDNNSINIDDYQPSSKRICTIVL